VTLERLVRVKCDHCEQFLPPAFAPRQEAAWLNPVNTPLFTSEQDAVAAALDRGWSAYPLLCPACNNKESRTNG